MESSAQSHQTPSLTKLALSLIKITLEEFNVEKRYLQLQSGGKWGMESPACRHPCMLASWGMARIRRRRYQQKQWEQKTYRKMGGDLASNTRGGERMANPVSGNEQQALKPSLTDNQYYCMKNCYYPNKNGGGQFPHDYMTMTESNAKRSGGTPYMCSHVNCVIETRRERRDVCFVCIFKLTSQIWTLRPTHRL